MVIQSLINIVTQLLVFGIIPFLWWLATARKKEGFVGWIGFVRPSGSSMSRMIAVSLLTLVLFLIPGFFTILSIEDKSLLEAARFSGSGGVGLVALLLQAFGETALPEEIFFRGFLGKRLIGKFGFTVGNTIQAIAFGFIHIALTALSGGGIAFSTFLMVFLLPAFVGWLIGYINERCAGGSIVPGYLVHAASNVFTGLAFWLGFIV